VSYGKPAAPTKFLLTVTDLSRPGYLLDMPIKLFNILPIVFSSGLFRITFRVFPTGGNGGETEGQTPTPVRRLPITLADDYAAPVKP
jgi:hypothetical protein